MVEPVKVDVSVSEDGYYPLCALVSGVEWPPGVPPAKREQFLCPSEFESVFGMSKVVILLFCSGQSHAVLCNRKHSMHVINLLKRH